MNPKYYLFGLILISLIFDSVIISLPIVFIFSLLTYVLLPETAAILILVFTGILLDMQKATTVGLTPIALTISFAAIFLARQMFEVKDYRFVIFLLFILTYIYAFIAGYTTNLLIYLLIFILSGAIFSYFSKSKFLIAK